MRSTSYLTLSSMQGSSLRYLSSFMFQNSDGFASRLSQKDTQGED